MNTSFYTIQIYTPNSKKSKELIIEEIKENILVSELMNLLCFNSKYMSELDANFISVYNKNIDEFEYFIQRLLGYEMNDKYSWVPYINDVKERWTDICQNNRLVFKSDKIEFKYEQNSSN
jgi:hypothetical protein